MAAEVTPQDVLSFWRNAGEKRWWGKDDAFDAEIREKFLQTWHAAAEGKLSHWQETDEGALALVIVCDQFPRNMFRNDARTYTTDPLGARCRAAGRRQGRGRARAERSPELPLHAVHAFGRARRSGALHYAVRADRSRGEHQIRASPCGHRPQVRPLPASQPRAGAKHDRRRAGLSGLRRLFRLI